MNQEQEKAIKVVEKLIDRFGEHNLTSEEIMILVQGIMSNDCRGCNWKYVSIPKYEQPEPSTQPGLSPVLAGWRPGDVWCGDNPNISLYAEKCTTNELPKHFKNEKEMIEEMRLKFETDNMGKINTTTSTICAGDNIPDMQYKIH